MQKVLSVNELLALVLAHTDQATCAVAARVCKGWHEIASNELWRVLANPLPLVTVLAPVRFSSGAGGIGNAVGYALC